MVQTVKNLHAIQETRVRPLGWEDPLEKGMAPHSNIHAWRSPWTEEPGQPHSPRGCRVGHNSRPTQVLLQETQRPYALRCSGFSGGSVSKTPPAIQETWVRPLGWESTEEGTATHSSFLAWNPHGQRGLAGCNLWGHEESDATSTAVLVLFVLHILFVLKKGKSSQNLQTVSLDFEKNGWSKSREKHECQTNIRNKA